MIRVTALDVRCPSCGEDPGRRCTRLSGDGYYTAPHVLRRRRAADEQARLNPEHIAGQLPLWKGKVPS